MGTPTNSATYILLNLLALVSGQWLVTRGHWAGFRVWCVANLYSILTCVLTGIPGTSCHFGACFLVNFASLWSWLGKARLPEPAPEPLGRATLTWRLRSVGRVDRICRETSRP